MLIRLLLLSLLWAGLASPTWAARESDYLTRDYGRFAVTYCPEDSALCDPLMESLSRRLPVAAARLQLRLPDEARIVITPSAAEWARVTAGSPLWANGVAYPSRGVAILKSPRFNPNGGPLAETAIHEAVHLLLDAGAPASVIPRWLDEGLAQFLAGQQEYMDVHVLSRAAASGRLLTFWDIEGLMGMNALDAKQGYAQSLAAVEDLFRRYGDSGLANLVHELRQGKPIDVAFPRVFGTQYGVFEREYRAMLADHYGGSWWSDSELWVSLFFVILVLTAGMVAYLKRRTTLAKWRAEYLPPEPTLPRDVPYTVNYTLVRSQQAEAGESSDETGASDEGARHDRPMPGN